MKSDLKFVDIFRKMAVVENLYDLLGIFQPKVGQCYAPLAVSRWTDSHADYPADQLTASYYPIFRKCRFDQILIRIGGAGLAGALARLGIYADGAFKPGNLLLDAGEVDASTTGIKSLSIDITLDPGRYWLAFITNDGTIDFLRYRSYPPLWITPDWLDTPVTVYYASYTYGTLPSTFPSGSYSYRPFVQLLRVAEVF